MRRREVESAEPAAAGHRLPAAATVVAVVVVVAAAAAVAAAVVVVVAVDDVAAIVVVDGVAEVAVVVPVPVPVTAVVDATYAALHEDAGACVHIEEPGRSDSSPRAATWAHIEARPGSLALLHIEPRGHTARCVHTAEPFAVVAVVAAAGRVLVLGRAGAPGYAEGPDYVVRRADDELSRGRLDCVHDSVLVVVANGVVAVVVADVVVGQDAVGALFVVVDDALHY